MRIRLFLLALLAALAVVAATFAPSAASAPPAATQQLSVPIDAAQSGGVLNGVFTVTSFSVSSAGELVANGVFTGTATVGGITQTITSAASSVLQTTGTCPILDLTLGPLHLDLLGLVVDLNQVHLTITAQSGPGNLLGNLLCAVAHLLDGNASQTAVQRLLDHLNQLIARL
jgi:hypothetical protein